MRILMWLTIGFTAACAVGAYIGIYPIAAIIALGLGIVLLFFSARPAKMAAIALLGLFAGTMWCYLYQASYISSAMQYDGKTISSSAVLSDYSYKTDYGVAADGKISLDGKEFSIRLYLSSDTPLKPGDRVAGKVRLRLTTNQAIQGQTYHQGDGIFLLGYVQEGAEISPADKIPNRFLPAKLRYDILKILTEAFPPDTLAFANALILGDSSLLDYETDTDFKVSGIRHIIAVSGLHVSILLSIVFLICGKNRYLSGLVGIPLLLVFAAVVGFTPSVMRACIMQMLMLIGMFFGKEYDPPTSLSFAVLVMLICNPITIVSVSFQLSLGCVIGIFLLFEPVNRYLLQLLRAPIGKSFRARLCRWLSSSVSITVSTFVATTPLSAFYFGSVSIVGILTNLLTLWIVSFIFCGIVAAVLSGVIWLPLAQGIGWVVSWPIRYVIMVAKLLADIPVAAVYTKSVYIVIWLVACYVLFAAFFMLRRKRPLFLTSCLAMLLVLAIVASWVEPKLDRYRVTIFDVGQGQSILIQYKGVAYLVDCGGDSNRVSADTVSQYLLSAGITHLDGVIVTHYDKDHAGGVPNLLSRIPADTLFLPDVEEDEGVKDSLSMLDAKVHWVSDLQRLTVSGMDLGLLPGSHPTIDNEGSMCVLFQIENYDILITGDRSAVGERELLKKMNLPQVDLLIAGHHGSGSATSLELLEAVRPSVVAISVGRDNFYGHPSEDVLYRLRLFGCSVLRTDIDGTIILRG